MSVRSQSRREERGHFSEPLGQTTGTQIYLALNFLAARAQERWGQILNSTVSRKVSGSRSDQGWQRVARQCYVIPKPHPWLGCTGRRKGSPYLSKVSTLKMPWSCRPKPAQGTPVLEISEVAGSHWLSPSEYFLR